MRFTLANVMSGLATILIVASTVLAFMFEDVSILLALLMMRLGVLFLAPIIDVATGRKVPKRTLVAALICACGLVTAGATGTFSPLSLPVLLVLGVYLISYGIRLSLMATHTKSLDRAVRGDWFVIEISLVLTALLLFGIFGGITQASLALQSPSALITAAVSGAAYAYALINGTLIYLDWRENAHSVTVNRSTSLLSGVAASLLGWALLDFGMPAFREWALAACMALALIVLANVHQGLFKGGLKRSA